MAATMVGANLIASHVFNLSLGTPYKQATRESSMASNEDVEDESTDENILYDLTIHAEWKQENELFRKALGKDSSVSVFGRLTSSTQRAGWTFFRTLGLPIQTASPCYLPPALVKLVNCKINWHIAVSRDGKNVAVLQDHCIEIRSRRDAYETVTGRVSINSDTYPQWRHLVWSPDSTMVACSYSSGVLEVFDIVGTLLFTIPASETSPNPNLPTDLSGAVAALIFTDLNPGDEWTSELLVINFHGSLKSYKVDRDKGFEFQHSFLFHNRYPLGISSVVYHPGAGLMYVGGCGLEDEAGSEATKEGLSAWRILSDYPHYKLVTDYADDLRQSLSQRSLVKRLRLPSLNFFKKENQDGVFKMSLSPSGKYLAVVHLSGKFSLWNMPSLKLMKMWDHSEQPFSGDLSPEFTETPHLRKQLKGKVFMSYEPRHEKTCLLGFQPDLVPTRNLIDVNWWSEEAVILARCTGAITVSSIKTLKNLLGTNPEWLEPAPHVGPVHDGGFIGLEVECRFPSKRRLVIGDDDNEEDSDDDEGMMSKTTRYSKQVLHYVTDMERFQPPKKKPRLVNRTYRLVCLKSTTPEELYARKLDNEEYGEAKALAEAYGLDCDLVYQRQWRKSPVEIASIQDYLSKISKRSWVLHECLERMSDSIDAMKELLEFGLRGTDLPALIMIGKGEDKGRFILCDEEEGLYEDLEFNPFDPEASSKKDEIKLKRQEELLEQVDFKSLTLEQRELCKARKKLVQYLYRLKTYECILGGVNYAAERFDSKFFEKFRSQNIVETAVQYAQSSDWKALETLFTFHSEELMPHRLAILSNFPETTSPAEYKILLPEISDGCVMAYDSERWNQYDWVEMDPCRTAIEQTSVDLGTFLYEQQAALGKFRNASNHSQVTQWYKYRAFEIERLSRQADFALELVKLGVERGVQGLDDILDDLVTMEMLVYDCHIDDSLTFQELRRMADYEKLELFMNQSSDEMYSKNVKKWLVPFLRQCEQKTPGTYNSLVRDYVVTMAKTDLTRPLKVFELSKVHLGSPVIVTQTELMSTAIEALYGCERADQLGLAMEVLKCLPQRGVGTESREVKKLHEQVDQLEHHLNASRILEENGIKKPIYFIKDTEKSPDEAEQLIIKMTRMAGRRDPPLGEAQWTKLHGDIIELQDKVYRCISQGLCHEIFVESLLCSNSTNNIYLAGKLIERTEEESRKPTPRQYNMQTRVPYDRAIELVLAASQEYFNSAANLTDQCMVLARSCLNLIQDSPAKVQEENDLIASLSLLEEFGVKILPLQVRLCKDRLSLVKDAVMSKPGAFKQKQKFVRLGHLLRIPGAERTEREGKVLHLVAQAALQSGDYQFCYDICEQLIEWCHGAAWDVCVDLAEAEGFHSLKAKVELLSFAVTYCSVDMIEPVLQARTLLETQVLYEGLTADVESVEGRSSRISPFSARAAFQQTQHILRSTKDTTKAVLSTVTDTSWWQGAIHKLKQPTKRQISLDYTERNKKMELQSCHPFYDGIIQNCYSNVDEVDLANGSISVDHDVEMSEKVLRTAQLEEILTQGEKSQSTNEVLLQLAGETFPTDNTLSLAYLLALQNPTDADRCFEDHPKTDISLQLAIYYYTLQIYSSMKPCSVPDLYALYTHPPVKVMQKVVSLVTQKTGFDWPDEVKELIVKIKQYNKMLEDYRQAKVLRKLGRGIDVERFAQDAEYKEETILGLAMSLEDNIYGISVSLADRYEIPLWQVYAAHLEFLFSDSGLSTEEVEARVSSLDILPTLKSQPEEFCKRLQTYIYPTLEGGDHTRLLYYYSVLSGCDVPLDGGLTADAHVKLLKRVKTVMPDLDYKAVMVEGADVMTELSPCLSAANVNNSAKLAKQLPDGYGGFLDASTVYCVWAVKFFWEGDSKRPPDNTAAWLHRYEACREYIQKLSPRDVAKFTNGIIFTSRARQQLDVDCRQEICKRVVKFCRQNINKKKRPEESRKDYSVTWEEISTVIDNYREHLDILKTPFIVSLKSSEINRVQEYLETYDLSKGSPDEIHKLLIKVLLDGEESLGFIQELLSVRDSESWTLVTVIKEALSVLLEKLTSHVETSDSIPNIDPLPALKHIVESVQAHTEQGGDLVTSEDILLTLRPFCSDSTIEVQSRLDVLQILEQSFKLSEEDSRLLTLYRTQAVVTEAWADHQISEKDIKTSNSRLKLFNTLLEKNSKGDHSDDKDMFSALCRLLQLWPPFPGNVLGSVEQSPWINAFKAMIQSGYHGNIADVIGTVQTMPDPGLTKNCTEVIYSEMLEHKYTVEAVKFCLVVGHADMFPSALDVLSKVEQEITDTQLTDLILKHKLVPSLVQSAHYPIIIEYLLANQDPDQGSPDHLNIERLANQLLECGFDAEAGSLLLHARATHSMLQTFGSAIDAIGKWLKK